jgi:hypothetical protein
MSIHPCWLCGHLFKNLEKRRDHLIAVVDSLLNGRSGEVAFISFQVREYFLELHAAPS